MGMDDGLAGRSVGGKESSGRQGSASQRMIDRWFISSFGTDSPESKITTHPLLLPSKSWPEEGLDTALLAPSNSIH
jgi:hypothetical protein